MANRDKKKNKRDKEPAPKEYKRGPYKLSTEEDTIEQNVLKPSTIQSVWGIAMFVLAIFFLFASLNKGGSLGNTVYNALSKLLGIGYYLIPITFVLLSIAFFGERNKKFYLSKSLGALLFLLSSLGVISLINLESGGFVGKMVAIPLVKLFDYPTSYVITIALAIISILIIYDSSIKKEHLMFWKLFNKKASDADEEATPNDGTIKETEDEKISKSIKEAEASAAGNKVAQQDANSKSGNQNTENTGNRSQDQSKTAGSDGKSSKEKEDDSIDLKAKSTWSGKTFIPPPLSILEQDKGKPGVGDIKANANIIKRTLQNFGIDVEMDEVSIGPSVTRYALKPAEGVKLSKILGLQNNLSLALAAHPIRIEAPIPGKSLVGIEIPNTIKTTVGLGSLLAQDEYQKSEKPLMVALGKGISGKSYFTNLAKAPHMLIAGATGSGKSVTIHAIIASLLYKNSSDNLKFIMIDPKRVELTMYNKIPHLLTPVITDAKKSILSLKWAAKEMERRYNILEKHGIRDIDSYHKNILKPLLEKRKNDGYVQGEEAPETMPYIVIVLDELADIMQAYPRELESGIVKLAQMSRAVGIHLIISTQRPSVNVITGLIKANVPARIALQVASQIDSRTILDMRGAEELLGAGDMLFLSGDIPTPIRIQCAYVTENETKKLVKYLIDSADSLPQEISFNGDQGASPTPDAVFSSSFGGGDDDEDEDDLYDEAKQLVIEAGRASTSYLQRKLRVGYARAARLMDILEDRGVIGPADGSKPREILSYNGQNGNNGQNGSSSQNSGANNNNNDILDSGYNSSTPENNNEDDTVNNKVEEN
jgi:S-DNA-T family DNA segregation ATPase FtsK/SpoIIIE